MCIPPEFVTSHHCGSHLIFQKKTAVMICKSQPSVIDATDLTTASCLLNG